jgi:hypothetical protein
MRRPSKDSSYQIVAESDENSLWLDIATPPIDSDNIARHLPLIIRLSELPLSVNGQWQAKFGLNLIDTTVEVEDENTVYLRFRFDWDFSDAASVSQRVAAQVVEILRSAGESVNAII